MFKLLSELHELLEVDERDLSKAGGSSAEKSKPWDTELAGVVAAAVMVLIGVALLSQLNVNFDLLAASGDVAASGASGRMSYNSLEKTGVGE